MSVLRLAAHPLIPTKTLIWPFACLPPDEMKKLSHLIVNSGSLCFSQFQISIYCHPHMHHHLLGAWVHWDIVWLDFLYDVVQKCGEFGWFENDHHTLREVVEASRVKHDDFDPNSSRPTDPELKLVETSSAESTVGSALSHVTTSSKNLHPNFLDISFVR